MDIDRFWQLIETARAAAGPQAEQAVRDLDDPDEPGEDDRDYWDFDEEELEALVNAARKEFGTPGVDAADEDDEEFDDDDEDDLTDPVAVALFELLVQLPAGEIADFDNTFEDVRARAGTDMHVGVRVGIGRGNQRGLVAIRSVELVEDDVDAPSTEAEYGVQFLWLDPALQTFFDESVSTDQPFELGWR